MGSFSLSRLFSHLLGARTLNGRAASICQELHQRAHLLSGSPGTPKRLLGIVDPSIEPDRITESRGSVRRKEFPFASSPRNAPMRAAGGNAICTHRVRGNGVDESLTSPFLP